MSESYDARMMRLALEDAERYIARMRAEYDGTDYCHSRNITGEPSERNRDYKASETSWSRGLRGRTFGVAAAIDNGRLDRRADAHTVRVTRNGHTTIEEARGFGRATQSRQASQPRVTAADRPGRRILATDARFGNAGEGK